MATRHAGGKWRLSYTSVSGRTAGLSLDVNFLASVPLWPPVVADSKRVGAFAAARVPILDMHDLAAGKLAALFGRSASRDLFDARGLFASSVRLDPGKPRTGFAVHGGMNRRDWRTVSLDDVKAEPAEVDRQLVPLLRADIAPDRRSVAEWTRRLVDECRSFLSAVLPLSSAEMEFLDGLNERGEIAPNLLTEDEALLATIRSHPGLRWKALNVRKHRGLATDAFADA